MPDFSVHTYTVTIVGFVRRLSTSTRAVPHSHTVLLLVFERKCMEAQEGLISGADSVLEQCNHRNMSPHL